jgi:hypothetical protein
MPYIGNTAADRFVAPKAASVFSGDGSTTAFTLDHSVGSDEDILVSVDGVIQEPSVAYSVSGTTLTFTAAPSSNAGNNIFVYYLFRTVGTVSHPSSNALEATSGTFTSDLTVDTDTLHVDSTNNRVGVGTSSPDELLELSSGSPKIKLTDTNNTIGQTGLVSNISAEDSAGTTTWVVGREFGSTALKVLNKENSSTIFETNSTETLRIQAGGGISFNGDTSADNALSDYEEGSWTPTFTTNSGSAATATISQASYTKIGRVVYINLRLVNIDPTGTTSSSQLQIDGLPFTIDTINGIATCQYENIAPQSTTTQITVEFNTAEYIRFFHVGGDTADLALDHGDLRSGGTSDIFFTGFYFTNQ